jgi:predicted DNA-binding transcriptional regulator AlpA
MKSEITRASTGGAIAEPRFVDEKQLATITGISKRTWQKHRLFSRGPRFYKICGSVRYDIAEVIAWIRSNAGGNA